MSANSVVYVTTDIIISSMMLIIVVDHLEDILDNMRSILHTLGLCSNQIKSMYQLAMLGIKCMTA